MSVYPTYILILAYSACVSLRATQAQEKQLKELLHQKGATGVAHARDRYVCKFRCCSTALSDSY